MNAVDHAARFAALDSDALFALESAGDCEDAQAHIESLLNVLAEWRPRIVALLADAPAWSIPEADAYERAVTRVREAWLQYSFRWQGGPDLPDTFDLPQPAPAPRRVVAVGRIVRRGHRTLTVRATPAGVTGSIRTTAVTA